MASSRRIATQLRYAYTIAIFLSITMPCGPVRDLDQTIRAYETLGSAVTRGRQHADDLTRNALIPFKGGSYLELVAFLNPTILGITSGAGGRSSSPAVV
jgi:hypothetical protein